MLIKVQHPELEEQKTRLTADAAASDTSATVKNNDGFSTNDYVVFGKPGEEQSEIVILTGTTGNNTLNFTGGTVFAHSSGDAIQKIKYNQVAISTASTEDGSYSVADTVNLDIDEIYTIYDHTSGSSTDWYKVRYYNSTTTTYSSYSDTVQGSGYTADSLYDMREEVLEDFEDEDAEILSRSQADRYLRAAIRKVVIEIIKRTNGPFLTSYTTQSLTADTASYSVPTRFIRFLRVEIDFDGGGNYTPATLEKEKLTTDEGDYSQSDPYVTVRGSNFIIKPTPDSSSGEAKLWYDTYPSEMSSEADEHGLPYGARDLVVAYGLYRSWKNRDREKAADYFAEFDDGMNDYVEFLSQQPLHYRNKKTQITTDSDLYGVPSVLDSAMWE